MLMPSRVARPWNAARSSTFAPSHRRDAQQDVPLTVHAHAHENENENENENEDEHEHEHEHAHAHENENENEHEHEHEHENEHEREAPPANPAELPPNGTDMVGPVKVSPDLLRTARSLSFWLLRTVKTTNDAAATATVDQTDMRGLVTA
jgi:hypothetical protein